MQWSNTEMTTIPALLEKAVAKWPDRCFLDFAGDKHTYADIDRESNRFAHGLTALGISAGDRVCVMLDNCAELVVAWFATNKLGAIFVPFNTSYKGEYLRNQIADTGATVMFVQDSYLDRVLAVSDRTPDLRTIICKGEIPPTATHLSIIDIAHIRSDDASPITTPVSPEDPAIIHYTSGTTGPSKGGVMGHSFACNMGAQQVWLASLESNDVIWTPCPLFHGTGMFMTVAALTAGATASIYPHFSVSKFWPEMERSGATVVLMLSIMLSLIPDAPETDASRRCHGQIRVLYGAPLSAALKARWRERFGVKYVSSPGYGMTEASMVTMTRADDPNVPGDASGRRFDDFDVRVIDDEGNECPPNTPGEIIVRPRRPGIMFQGYWGRPEATLQVFKDLWLRTGDIGKFDENDYFYFLDRKKDYLRRGGENISSFEVEETFQVHPAVSEVAAHAVPSELGEDDLKVTLVLGQDSQVTEVELYAWCIDRLPKFAVPRYIEFRTELPRTANGKVQKNILRTQGVTPETWDAKNP